MNFLLARSLQAAPSTVGCLITLLRSLSRSYLRTTLFDELVKSKLLQFLQVQLALSGGPLAKAPEEGTLQTKVWVTGLVDRWDATNFVSPEHSCLASNWSQSTCTLAAFMNQRHFPGQYRAHRS